MTSAERHEQRYQRRRAQREAKKRAANEDITFEKVFSFRHLYDSYRKCCLGVGWKRSTQIYRANAILNVANTHRALMAGTFRSRGFQEFDIYERGKPRHIRAVHISERVVQRCLCDYAPVPLLERSFIYDNGASMKGKGIDFALNRLERQLRKFWLHHGKEGWVLTFDVHRYFDSIPHDYIKAVIDRAIADERIKALTYYFIDQFGDVGMGLGSQVSQICALASLNALDHMIKERLGIRFYGRYMDDGYLIHHDRAHLQKCREEIIRQCNAIGFTLNMDKTEIKPLRRGFRFLKVRFFLTDSGGVIRLPNRRNTTAMRRKLRKFKLWVDNPLSRFTLTDAQTSFISWTGHIQHCNSWRTRQRMRLLFREIFGVEPELKPP